MKFFYKPIFTGFGPNLTWQDVKTACSFLFLPWNWNKLRVGEDVGRVENWLKNFFQTKEAFTFDSGRTALYFALQALGVGEGDEVLVQSYTCIVVINAIKWVGAKPIYVDVNNNFNMNPDDLIKKITSKTKVLIIQHTFGEPADLDKLLQIAKENNLKVIEDCAHSFGAKYRNKLTGTFGDIGMFSFGSDKIVSCGRGGALITSNQELGDKLRKLQEFLPQSTYLKIFQHLLFYPIFYFCKPIYNLGIGKYLLALAKFLHVYNRIIYPEEKLGLPVVFYPTKFPNALATVVFKQFSSLNEVILHQKEIAQHYHENINNKLIKKPFWNEESIWLRYTVLVSNPQKLHKFAKDEGIILGNWYDAPVAPKDTNLANFDYLPGMCPNDEQLAGESLNLPTGRQITLSDAKRVVEIINNYGN